MLSELNLNGVFIAPIVFYAVLAIPISWVIRCCLTWSGLARWFWHGALVDVCLYATVLFVVTQYL